jgi:hypothetical protein
MAYRINPITPPVSINHVWAADSQHAQIIGKFDLCFCLDVQSYTHLAAFCEVDMLPLALDLLIVFGNLMIDFPCAFSTVILTSVVEPEPELEPQGAGTFDRSRSWSRYTRVSAPAQAPGQTKVVYLIIISIE